MTSFSLVSEASYILSNINERRFLKKLSKKSVARRKHRNWNIKLQSDLHSIKVVAWSDPQHFKRKDENK